MLLTKSTRIQRDEIRKAEIDKAIAAQNTKITKSNRTAGKIRALLED